MNAFGLPEGMARLNIVQNEISTISLGNSVLSTI